MINTKIYGNKPMQLPTLPDSNFEILQAILFFSLLLRPGKRAHIVADTLLPTQMFPCLPARATFVADTNFVSGTQKCFWFCSETFCVRNKCFPVCAAQATSWATMCPQQCVLVYQGLYKRTSESQRWWLGCACADGQEKRWAKVATFSFPEPPFLSFTTLQDV